MEGKWHTTGKMVHDEKGCFICDASDESTAIEIVREHNARDRLVNLAKTFRVVANDGAHNGMVKLIDAALSAARGE